MISNGCINQVQILGRLGADPDLKATQSNNAFCTLSVATSYKYKDKSGEMIEKTDWHRVVFWGKSAESVAKYAKKGSRIMVEGMLQTRSWDDKDGSKRYATEIKADNFILLDFAKKSDDYGGDQHDPEDDPHEEHKTDTRSNAASVDDDDDLPF